MEKISMEVGSLKNNIWQLNDLTSQTQEDLWLEIIQDILIDTLGIEKEAIGLDSHIQDDLGADDLDTVEMIMKLEKELQIVIPDDHIDRLDTVRNVLRYLNKHHFFKTETKEPEMFLQPEMEEEPKQYEILKNQRFLTTLRRFKAKETFIEVRRNMVLNCLKDDVFEEILDQPNTFVNITKYQRDISFENNKNLALGWNSYLSLHFINSRLKDKKKIDTFSEKNQQLRERETQLINEFNMLIDACFNLEEIDLISVIESQQLEFKVKKTATQYKRKLKQLAKLNEDLTNMKFVLQIKE